MKITKTHVEKYVSIRSEIKEREEVLDELKGKMLEAVKEAEGGRIETPAGNVTLVTRGYSKLDEAKLMKALGVTNLDAFKIQSTSESVLVTAK